jgi:hypothetical protein
MWDHRAERLDFLFAVKLQTMIYFQGDGEPPAIGYIYCSWYLAAILLNITTTFS